MAEAANGRAAIEMLSEGTNSYKAVILDIAMPVMNGYEVLENVKIDEKLMNIPIIVYSSEDGTAIENKVMKLGVHSFIRKSAPKTDDEVSSRESLNNAIRNVNNGDTIKLVGDVIATEADTGIYIPSKSFTLDLNGYKIDRNLIS